MELGVGIIVEDVGTMYPSVYLGGYIQCGGIGMEIQDKPKDLQPEKDRLKPSLFDRDEFSKWRDEWQDMPEFSQQDLMSFRDIVIHFRTEADIEAFANLVGQKITAKTKFLWFPAAEIDKVEHLRWKSES